jgi:hypothetical protein
MFHVRQVAIASKFRFDNENGGTLNSQSEIGSALPFKFQKALRIYRNLIVRSVQFGPAKHSRQPYALYLKG